jgi:hypothetical protein
MLRTSRRKAEIVKVVEPQRNVQRAAWFRHRQDTSSASVPRLPTMQQAVSRPDLTAAIENTVEEAGLVADWRGSRSCGCA